MNKLAFAMAVASFAGGGAPCTVAVAASTGDVRSAKTDQTRVITEAELRQELLSHKGRPVVLHFWATWCEPCLSELPALARLARDVQRRGVDFVAVSLDGSSPRSVRRVSAVLAQRLRDPHWSSILNVDDPGAFVSSIDPNWEGAIPVFFAFDRDARLRRSHLGDITPGEFEQLIAGLATDEQRR